MLYFILSSPRFFFPLIPYTFILFPPPLSFCLHCWLLSGVPASVCPHTGTQTEGQMCVFVCVSEPVVSGYVCVCERDSVCSISISICHCVQAGTCCPLCRRIYWRLVSPVTSPSGKASGHYALQTPLCIL